MSEAITLPMWRNQSCGWGFTIVIVIYILFEPCQMICPCVDTNTFLTYVRHLRISWWFIVLDKPYWLDFDVKSCGRWFVTRGQTRENLGFGFHKNSDIVFDVKTRFAYSKHRDYSIHIERVCSVEPVVFLFTLGLTSAE